MKPIHSTRLFCLVAGLFLLFTGCAHTPRTDTRAEAWDGKSLESFPYHPLVYHLDLSILAYQLYGQTLVWPFDPYYEELGDDRDAIHREGSCVDKGEGRGATGQHRWAGRIPRTRCPRWVRGQPAP